jgi:hydroxyquinol 1,2-dioxygenase
MDGVSPDHPVNGVLHDLGLRMVNCGDGRLPMAFLSIVTGIHDLIAELKPSGEELRTMIDFLTEVGHSADARRQEWVLLADVIGVSTHVEDLNAARPDGATPNTLPGPFYREDVPEVALGTNLSRDGIGESLRVQLQLTDLDGKPVSNAVVDVWQANALGRYENQDPDLQPEFNLRGRLRSDAQGRVHFQSVKPRGYALPDDGPVGRLLNTLGLCLERPAHLHFRVTAPGFQVLTTHVFDRLDPAIGRDALFGVKQQLLADFRPMPTDGSGVKHALDIKFVLAHAANTDKASPDTAMRKEH